MPALQSQPQIISLEQYEALPEDVRAEVFDGQIGFHAKGADHVTLNATSCPRFCQYSTKKFQDKLINCYLNQHRLM